MSTTYEIKCILGPLCIDSGYVHLKFRLAGKRLQRRSELAPLVGSDSSLGSAEPLLLLLMMLLCYYYFYYY